MAEPEESVALTTSLFGLKLTGGNALFFFLLLMLGLNIGLTIYEHVQRSTEHSAIKCSTDLALYIFTSPRNDNGQLEINFERLPISMYNCLPQFLYKAQR